MRILYEISIDMHFHSFAFDPFLWYISSKRRKIMTEKLKINVTKRTADILEKDAESFEFFKADGRTLNKNALLTQLIVNYYERFRVQEEELSSYLTGAIGKETDLKKGELEALCRTIASHVRKREAAPLKERFDHTVSVKPTRASEPVLDYIEAYLLGGNTLSEYFRNLFSSYAALPQDEREKIVFRPQYEALERAIAAKKKVFLTTQRTREKGYELSPYRIAASKEELHCYLLAARGNECVPIRLSRIVSVTPLAEDAVFSPEHLSMFARMLAFGPQFRYGKREEEAVVQFTAHGMEMYRALYVHRPVPVSVENNTFTFACSHQQLMQYLVRFGRDAFVVRPASLRERIRTFYALAGKKYASANRHYAALRSEAAAADVKADENADERKAPPEEEQ